MSGVHPSHRRNSHAVKTIAHLLALAIASTM
jgi:hypothetical protein